MRDTQQRIGQNLNYAQPKNYALMFLPKKKKLCAKTPFPPDDGDHLSNRHNELDSVCTRAIFAFLRQSVSGGHITAQLREILQLILSVY